MTLAGIILAGGRSSRMNGHDKAFLMLNGRTLIENAISRLAPQVLQLAVSSNDMDPADFSPEIKIITDADNSRPGPLAGILAGLRWAATLPDAPKALVSVAVDTPFFPQDLIGKLASVANDSSGSIVVATSAGILHPTFALWPLALSNSLARYLEQGERKVRTYIDMHPHRLVDFPFSGKNDPFFNINTPADLIQASSFSDRQA